MRISQENTEPILYSEHKEAVDYLNSEKNKLITQSGCERTKIFNSEAGYIEPTIVIELITVKAYKQRKIKMPK